MATKKYVSLAKLSTFLDKLKTTFASLNHTHSISDLTDYTVDAALSDTSTNPVQNKVIDAEFDSIATAMNALESAVDGKASATHTHSIIDIEEIETVTNRTLLGECTSTGSEYINLKSVDFMSLSGKSVTTTVGDTEYEGICTSSVVDYYIDAGDYNIHWNLIDGMTSISPAPASGTVIKLESIESATVIPEEYIPDTIARQTDIDGKADAADPVFTGAFSQNRKENSTIGRYSHTEGNMTIASDQSSHAEGEQTTASGLYSHAEGSNTTASRVSSHAEGYRTTASGDYSHAEGSNTTASGNRQHVQGENNIADPDGTYAHIVGNGRSGVNAESSNAHTLDWDGNAWFAGDVYVGSTSGTHKDSGSKMLATVDQLDGKVNSDDHEWTMIYDSGIITEAVNAFANIDITGYKNLIVAVECVNNGTNTNTKNGSVTFVATNGTTYQFPVLTTMFSNGSYTSGCMARFEIMNGWIICPCAPRTLRASSFLNVDVEGGTADTLANTYGGLMKCTNTLSTMMISALDQDTSYYLNAGSRAIVWGCKA